MCDGWLYRKVSSRLVGAALLVALMASFSLSAQVGGNGPEPIPAFNQDTGGGTGPTVTFDPSPSYLPAAPAGSTYQYTLIWDFGDGSGVVTIGPDVAANVLVPQTHTFADVYNQVFIVTLRIDVTVIVNNVAAAGPSAMTTGQVHAAQVNFAPLPQITPISSPATGVLPYQFIVDIAASADSDGYIAWAAIDWGDGSTDLISTLPPSKVALTYFHSYVAPGTYTVTLSVIDNGRMDPGTPLNPTPPANNPQNALALIKTQQNTLIDNGTVDPQFDDPKYAPILRQEYLQVQVPGNLLVKKGQFILNFALPFTDSFDATFDMNTSVASVANAQVSVFLGNALVLKEFTTDLKGKFFDKAQGFSFSLNPKRRELRIKLKNAVLMPAFAVSDNTVVNGFVDVPVKINISGVNGSSTLASKLRFVYNATAGRVGIGKNPRSQLVGN